MKPAEKQTSLLIEVCVETVADALLAAELGADRIELNSAIGLGGLTPSTNLLRKIVQNSSIPVICMLRPRAGHFIYTQDEFELMLADAEELLGAGAAGLAFGFLTGAGKVNESCVASLKKVTGNLDTVFHRAFDLCPNQREALEILCQIGITRVMTSGGAETAIRGTDSIRDLVVQADGRIEVLPACGVTADNFQLLVERTGCVQIHGTFRRLDSLTGPGHSTVNFNQGLGIGMNEYYRLDSSQLKRIRSAMR